MTGILLGCPLWGDKFIDRFLRYCLPSMMEPANRAALDGSRILIYTDAPGIRRLRPQAPLLELREITLGEDRWATMLDVQKDILAEAAASNMGAGALQPDVVFPAGYFERLLAIGQTNEAILGLGIWANADTVLRDLDRIKENGFLRIPAVQLGEIGWQHLHPMWRRYIMNGLDIDKNMPGAHLIAWVGADTVRIHCSHVNPLWLSPRLCAEAKVTNTLDAIIPDLLGNAGVYVAQPQDGLVPLEFADPDNKPQHVKPGPFYVMARHFWGNAPCLDIFKLPMRVPIGRANGLPDREIDAQFSRILGRLEGWWLGLNDAKLPVAP